MSVSTPDIIDQAIAWHLRLSTATDVEWMEFTEWLESDRAHATAYDRVVEDDILVAPALDLGRESKVTVGRFEGRQTGWGRRRGWMVVSGGAIAASVAAFVLAPAMQTQVARMDYTTAPGERREVALEDGTRVELNGGTELTVDGKRRVSLDHGQAVFHVRHDARDPFQVAVGGVVLRDLGTVFDVTREAGHLGVKVAEGAVMYQPDQESVTLKSGMALSTRDGDDRVVVRHVEADSVGGWRDGRLAFREASLGEVVAEISRTTGQKLAINPALADTSFTGAIRLAHDPAIDARRVAALAGLSARRSSAGWILTSVGDAPN